MTTSTIPIVPSFLSSIGHEPTGAGAGATPELDRDALSAVTDDDDKSAGGGSKDEAAGAEALRGVTGATRSSTMASSSSSTTAESRARPRPRQQVRRVHGRRELVVGTMGSGSSETLKVFDEMSSPT
ncbi:hypothetical protein ACQJBY_007552 [Aegilops geniculata]